MFTKRDKNKTLTKLEDKTLPELENKTNEEKPIAQALDGGWGWVVVFSSLLLNILLDGISLSYGVLLPILAEYFQAPKSYVSLIGSILIGTYMCSGVGFGMMYLSSFVSVGIYFEKKRPIANGIAACGSGIGTFIFSPVIEYLSEIYDWQNVLMIAGGIILNGAVCGMLMRPLKYPLQADINKATNTITKLNQKNEDLFDEECKHLMTGRQNDDCTTHENQLFLKNDELILLKSITKEKSKSCNNIGVVQNVSNDITDMPRKATNQQLTYVPFHKSLPNIKSLNEFAYSKSEDLLTNSIECGCIPPCIMEIFDFTLLLNLPFMLICFGNLFSAGAYALSFMYLVDSALLLGIPSTKAAFLMSVIGIANTVARILVGILANMKHVDALVVNNIALVIASIMLFVQPFCTTYPSLVIFGIIYGLCIGGSPATVMKKKVSHNVFIVSILAAYVSLTSIILCDILGVEKLANSFGFLGLTRGIACVVGPFLAGMVYQSTGSYDFSFHFGGVLFLLGAIFHLMLHLPCIKREKK